MIELKASLTHFMQDMHSVNAFSRFGFPFVYDISDEIVDTLLFVSELWGQQFCEIYVFDGKVDNRWVLLQEKRVSCETFYIKNEILREICYFEAL